MASFFAKARERAEAAAQQLQAHHAASSANKNSDAAASGDGTGPGSGSVSGSGAGSGFTYTGSVPHLFRQGLASVDPRYESTRQFHLLSQAVKSFNIDHEAAGREAKRLAKATFVWGQHHLPERRHDGVGDEMLADVTDRLAYVWHEIGQLETAHSQRSEQARTRLKRFEKTEMELGQRRANRIKLKKELHDLVPERAISAGSARAQEAQSRLQDLIDDDQADEESLSRLKRESVQDGYAAMFDSLIELGEKMALVARYGKLLTTLVSTEKSPFPATVKPRGESIPLWDGASKTADVRAALASVLSSFQPDLSLPALPADSALSTATNLSRAETVSYAVSHKAELQDDQDATAAASPAMTPAAVPLTPRRSSVSSDRGDLLQPGTPASQASGGGSAQKLNLSPTTLPAPLLPPRPQRSPSATGPETLRSPTVNPFADSAAAGAAALAASGGSAVQDGEAQPPPGPPGPTVAETGVVPTGPGGPKSGTLRPRRSSAGQRSASISASAVAYLGPTGTYSHQAALKVFGEAGTNLIPMQSITGAIDFVRRGTPGNAKISIVPVENSTFGPVRDTLDNLLGISNGDRHAFKPSDGAQLHVVGEACLSVDHALLCGPKTYHHLLQLQGDTDPNAPIRDDTLSNITNVISHEQALGQCSQYLTRYLPQAQKKAVESTAAAAVTALEFEAGTAPGRASTSVDHALGFSSNSLVAAVGAEAAATTVGVRVLRSKIQDVKDNRTRFLILASVPLQALLAANALPQSIMRLYTASTPTGKTGRSLLSVNDALTSDLAAEAGNYSSSGSVIGTLVAQLEKVEGVSVRKVDRRPASPGESPVATSSVWRSGYLIELHYPAASANDAEANIRQVVAESSIGSSATTTLGGAAPVSYLGSWLVDATTLRGEPSKSAAGQAPPALPAAGSSISHLSQTTLPATTLQLTEREKKELEAQQEAAEVQRHAAQARLSRQQQQADLYGAGAQPSGSRTQPLSGLQESEAEQRLDDEERLPAYQPLDPSSRP